MTMETRRSLAEKIAVAYEYYFAINGKLTDLIQEERRNDHSS